MAIKYYSWKDKFKKKKFAKGFPYYEDWMNWAAHAPKTYTKFHVRADRRKEKLNLNRFRKFQICEKEFDKNIPRQHRHYGSCYYW